MRLFNDLDLGGVYTETPLPPVHFREPTLYELEAIVEDSDRFSRMGQTLEWLFSQGILAGPSGQPFDEPVQEIVKGLGTTDGMTLWRFFTGWMETTLGEQTASDEAEPIASEVGC